MESLVIGFRARVRPRTNISNKGDELEIFIGSVWVTGETVRSRTQHKEKPFVFHFFSHPCHKSSTTDNSHSTGFSLLPWMDINLQDEEKGIVYRRIGRTPWIAKGGWKAFRIPRFDNAGHSLYEATPHETYVTWQDPSRALLKLGHWNYSGHHDLLTVNLLLAFDTEIDQVNLLVAGRLARFVFANLFRTFAIKKDDLTEDGKRLWDWIEKDKFKRLIPCNPGSSTGILVYPSHPVTDHVIGRLTNWINNKNKLAEVHERCVPILPLRRYRTGSGVQLSGLTIEHLNSFIKSGHEPPPVTFFDDALITGHTYQQVKSLLYGLGFKQVYSVAMLDRQRLPSASHVSLNPKIGDTSTPAYRNVCYWRLDAPSMGSEAHCPLCKGIGRVKDLARNISSPERKQRALDWLKTWAERNPALEWGDGGLRPIPLALKKPTRKFCIEPDPDKPGSWKQAGDGKEITLTNSAGLVAWVTELHSTTFRDDLPLKFLESKSETLDPETRIQLCASQLLLFHGEFDHDLALTLSFHLAKALYEAKTHDRNTALAAITLLSCGNELIEKTLHKLKNEFYPTSPAIVPDENTNLDFITMLELHHSANPQIDHQPALLPTPYILSDKNRKFVYRNLQNILFIGTHRFHSSIFKRIEEIRNRDNNTIIVHLEEAINSSQRLKNTINETNPLWFRYHGESNPLLKSYQEFYGKIIESLNNFIYLANHCKNKINKNTFNKNDIDNLINSGDNIIKSAEQITSSLFSPLGFLDLKKGNAPKIHEELQKSIKLAVTDEKEIKIINFPTRNKIEAKNLDGSKTEYFVILDDPIKRALDHVISNVRHAYGDPIPCPWGGFQTEDKEGRTKAHLWIRKEDEEKQLVILLINNTKTSAEDIQEKTKNKTWIKTFTEIGGDLSYSNFKKTDNGHLVQTRIAIPYSFYLDG